MTNTSTEPTKTKTVVADENYENRHALLLNAVSKGDVEQVRLLLKACDYDVSVVRDEDNLTLLMLASREGYNEIVQLLLLKVEGIDVNQATKPARNPVLDDPAYKKIVWILKMFSPKLEHVEMRHHTALVLACESNHITIIETLLEHGADINLNQGKTALSTTAIRGYEGATKLLLRIGADPNIPNLQTGSTPLFVACMMGHTEIAKLLIEHGANVNAKSRTGVSCLSIAVSRRKTDIVKFLLQHQANPNTSDVHGFSPLLNSVLLPQDNDTREIRNLLLAHGAVATGRMLTMATMYGGSWSAVRQLWAHRCWKVPSANDDNIQVGGSSK